MNSVNYETIFNEAVELVKNIPFEEADKNLSRLDKEVAIIFDKHFKEDFLKCSVNIQGHQRGMYDGKTIKQIQEEFEYEHITERFKSVYQFSISYNLMLNIIKHKDNLSEHKEKIINDFIREIETPFNSNEVYCFDCGCTAKVKRVSDEYTSVVKEGAYLFNKPSQLACQFKNQTEEFSYVINVPSGKLAFANDFRTLFPDEEDKTDQYITDKSGYYNTVNSLYGQQLYTEFWLKLGLIYVSVGNTSPNIFKDTKTNIISAKHETIYNRETDEEFDNVTADEVEVGRICTDLWAICGMDYDLLVERSKIMGEESDEFIDCIVDVPAGDCTLTIYRTDGHHFFKIVPIEVN